MKVQGTNHLGPITYHYDIIQNTDEWHQIRCGRIGGTSSNTLLVKGKGDDGLGVGAYTMMYQKADELINGVSDVEELKNYAQQRGHDLEPVAKERYTYVTGNLVHDVGYVSQGILFGTSPDGLINDDGGVEIKCPLGKEYVRYMDTLDINPKYYAQVQWSMYITGRKWWDFVYFNPKFENCDIIIKRYSPSEKVFDIWDKNIKIYEQRITKIIDDYNEKAEKGYSVLL